MKQTTYQDLLNELISARQESFGRPAHASLLAVIALSLLLLCGLCHLIGRNTTDPLPPEELVEQIHH